MKKVLVVVLIICLAAIIYFLYNFRTKTVTINKNQQISSQVKSSSPTINDFPLSIAAMKQKSYPGSDITVAQILSPGANYNQYIVSYRSEGLKIYSLLTVPIGQKPAGGWPVILLNHGYIPPPQYSTASSYASMVVPLASAGYIVFKPDYRGNGNSEGTPTQVYISPDYITDSMNALASLKKYKDANPQKIGVLGHSMGGNITLHELVITHDFKAAVVLAGVVGSTSQILSWWNVREQTGVLTTENDLQTLQLVKDFVSAHGTPQSNQSFWLSIDPTTFIPDITAPIQIQVGTSDDDVPPAFSQSFRDKLQQSGKTVDYHEYQGADHNLQPDLQVAIAQAVTFFNKYLK